MPESMSRIRRQNVIGILMAVVLVSHCSCQSDDTRETGMRDDSSSYADARTAMVRSQIEGRGIEDQRLLEAMRKVPRHLFVPENVRSLAYGDRPLPIGNDQTISQPYIVALMTELAQLDGTEKVLEVGTGSGYQAAILGELAASVFSIEIVEDLALRSGRLLDSLGYKNITVRSGDGYAGWETEASFDAIIVTCAPPEIPLPLIDQLAEGGRMIVPVGERWQELILLEKKDGEITRSSITPVRFVPMTGPGIKSQEKEADEK